MSIENLISRISWRNRSLRGLAIGLVAVLIGMPIGTWVSAVGEIRKTAPPEAFKAGDERNEVILREILAVMKRIDGRLERLEATASQWGPNEADRAPPANAAPPSSTRSRR